MGPETKITLVEAMIFFVFAAIALSMAWEIRQWEAYKSTHNCQLMEKLGTNAAGEWAWKCENSNQLIWR